MTLAGLDVQRHCWPRYCEENVWHLCGQLGDEADAALVAFISNAAMQVAVWRQRAARNEERLMAWDYHVVLLVRAEPGWQVYDADSILACPCPAEEYLAGSFEPLPAQLARYWPRFRLVPASLYRESLQSDRRHMRNAGGLFRSPPPPWPCIGEGSNLMRFADTEGEFLGEVVDLPQLKRRLAAKTSTR